MILSLAGSIHRELYPNSEVFPGIPDGGGTYQRCLRWFGSSPAAQRRMLFPKLEPTNE
jgi:hypothetical protein